MKYSFPIIITAVCLHISIIVRLIRLYASHKRRSRLGVSTDIYFYIICTIKRKSNGREYH